jgi:hypothetical protein
MPREPAGARSAVTTSANLLLCRERRAFALQLLTSRDPGANRKARSGPFRLSTGREYILSLATY